MSDVTELMDELREPFDPEVVSWKPQATSGNRALAIAYADARAYQDRLNDIAGMDWSDQYEILDGEGEAVVLCKLTVFGVTRSDIGEAPHNDPNTATSALSQAFKRAAVKFGVGRYLYDLPKQWVDWDPERKRFTRQAYRQLRDALEGSRLNPSPPSSQSPAPSTSPKPSAPSPSPSPSPSPATKDNGNGQADATTYWSLYNERCAGIIPRERAQALAQTGDWATAIEKLKELCNG